MRIHVGDTVLINGQWLLVDDIDKWELDLYCSDDDGRDYIVNPTEVERVVTGDDDD